MVVDARCDTCRYHLGQQCRRFPPTEWDNGFGKWPTIQGFWWCGEWQTMNGVLEDLRHHEPRDEADKDIPDRAVG